MKGCENSVDIISEIDIEWFYKISPAGLAINKNDLDKILKDKNMPKDVKGLVREAFPRLKQKGFRFW